MYENIPVTDNTFRCPRVLYERSPLNKKTVARHVAHRRGRFDWNCDEEATMQNARIRLGLKILPVFFTALFFMTSATARAGGYFAGDPDSQPSIFSYVMRGMGVGAIDGLASGYLIVHTEASSMAEWRILLMSTGIGALGGMGLGLGTGFIDLMMYRKYPNGDYVGLGAIILRDSLYGALIGALAGVIGGGVAALANDEPKSIAFGAAIGALSGTGAGILIGVIEGKVLTARHRRGRRARIWLAPTPMMTAARSWTLGPGIMGTF